MANGTFRILASVCASSVLPRTGRPDQQDIALLQLYFGWLGELMRL